VGVRRRGEPRRAPVWVLLLALAAAGWSEAATGAAPAAVTPVPDPLGLIGMSLAEAYAALGSPAEVLTHRGTESWQDDVVFYYPAHLYLFWYRNRVWQVRADTKYADAFLGLRMGWTREEVTAALGRPSQELADSTLIFLPDASLLVGPDGRSRGAFPLRLRVFFQDGKLTDAYLYRADF
jgi:hypothetical protein